MAKTNFLLEHEIDMQMFAAEIFVGNLKIEVTALMLLKLLNYNLPSLKNKMQHMMMQAEREGELV